MTWGRPRLEARADRKLEKRDAARQRRAARPTEPASTAQEKLVRAAETGRFEALVAAAQTEPPKMVTPEEREAELRAAGKAVDDKPKRKRKPRKKKPALEPGMPTEPTPGMKWAEEHMRRRPRGSGDRSERVPYGQCQTEYDPLTGEIIGDGYIHYDDEDE